MPSVCAAIVAFSLTIGLTGSTVERFDGEEGGSSSQSVYSEYDDEDPPTFALGSQAFTVAVGDTFTIPCDIINQGRHLLVIHHINTKGKKLLLSAGEMKLVRTERVQIDPTGVTIYDAQRQDAGFYNCSLPTAGKFILQHKLDVLYPPSVNSSSPPVQQAVLGQRLELFCNADGNPRPEIDWTFEGGALPAGAAVNQAGHLVIERVDRRVEGKYVCTADNGIGNDSYVTLEVVVEFPPEIITEKSVVRTGAGDQLELVCLARGRPSPRVSWTRKGQSVDHATHSTVADDVYRSTLVIRPMTEQDFGNYVCTAQNIHGQKSVVVQMTGLPQQPNLTGVAGGGKENSYTLTWETESYCPIVAYKIVFGRVQQKSAEVNGSTEKNVHEITVEMDVGTENGNTHPAMSHILNDLDASTEYEAIVKVKNRYGWSAESDKFCFATSSASPVHRSTSRSVGGAGERSSAAVSLLLPLLAAASACQRCRGFCGRITSP
ncbi:lachesin [Hyalella azteca]|uniref:Lachesin n=1 Tax=Hyalella azteca TaxID=294128 RepID=A0A979FFD7_HYAAZ|nr:lachesin [Hyalella azteca]